MKFIILSAITVGILLIGQPAIFAQTTTAPIHELEPSLCLADAVALAQNYATENRINISHFMQSASAIYLTDNPQGEWLWRVIWEPRRNVRSGQIIVNIKMDKSITLERGR